MAPKKPLIQSGGAVAELTAADSLDFVGTEGLSGLPASTANGQPVVHEQQVPSNIYRVSGSYVTPEITVAASASTFVHGTGVIKAAPFYITTPETVNQIWTDVAVLLAGATYRVALYTPNANGYPGGIISGTDVGTYDASTTGVKTANIANLTLSSPIWFAWAVSSNATMSLRGLAASNTRSISGNPNTGSVNSYSHLQANFVYGAMPATFPAGAGLQVAANGGVLKMLLRRA